VLQSQLSPANLQHFAIIAAGILGISHALTTLSVACFGDLYDLQDFQD
jgi:hypothetical protein